MMAARATGFKNKKLSVARRSGKSGANLQGHRI